MSCLASYAEEILGDAGNALANQNARICNLSIRIEQLDAKVQILNPKQIGMVTHLMTHFILLMPLIEMSKGALISGMGLGYHWVE